MLRFFSVCLLLSSSIAWAADAETENLFDYGMFFSGMLSYMDDSRDRDVNDGLGGFHLGIGRGFKGANAFEVNFVRASWSANEDINQQEQEGIGIDYLRRFGNDGDISPYVVLGAGILNTRYKNELEDNSGSMASIGLGLFIPLSTSRFVLRTEVRARKDYSNNGQTDYLLSFGLHFRTGKKIIPHVDSDNDSVIDSEDRCPGTTANVSVDRFGCAIK